MASLPRTTSLVNAGVPESVFAALAALPSSLPGPTPSAEAAAAFDSSLLIIKDLYAALEVAASKLEKLKEKHHGKLHPALAAFNMPKTRPEIVSSYAAVGTLQETQIGGDDHNGGAIPDVGALRAPFDAAMGVFQEAMRKEIFRQLGGQSSQSDRSTVCALSEVMDLGNVRFLNIYSELQKGFKGVDPEAHATFVALAAQVDGACRGAKRVCRQTSEDALEILIAAKRAGPDFKALLARVSAAVPGSTHKVGPLKKLYRMVEKSALRQENFVGLSDAGGGSIKLDMTFRFGRVCDVRRGFVQASTMAALAQLLEALLAAEKEGLIVIVRIKDRFSRPSAGGWSDCMVNFFFASDKDKHICEVQICHKELMVARAGLGGHGVYGKSRAAAELLELAAVATPFFRTIGLLLLQYSIQRPGQEGKEDRFKGWRASHDVRQWANVVTVDKEKEAAVPDVWATLGNLAPFSASSVAVIRGFGGPWESQHPVRTLTSSARGALARDAATLALLGTPLVGAALTTIRFSCHPGADDTLLQQLGKACPSLACADLAPCTATDIGVCALAAGCPGLQELNLTGATLTDVALGGQGLASCTKLEVLRAPQGMPNESITDKGATSIAQGCTALRHLDMQNWDVTSAGWTALAEACAGIEVLNHRIANDILPLPNLNVTDAALAARAAASGTRLLELNCFSCYGLGDDAMAALGSACPNLKALDVTINTKITDSGVESLASGCPKLCALFMSYDPTSGDYSALTGDGDARTDGAMEALGAHCPELEVLFACGWGASDKGIQALGAGCPRLRCANLQQMAGGLTDAGLVALAKGCPDLCCLNLTGNPAIAGQGLAALGQCSSLLALVLQWCQKVDDDAIVGLLAGPASNSLVFVNAPNTAAGDKAAAALRANGGILAVVGTEMIEADDKTMQARSDAFKSSYASELSEAWGHPTRDTGCAAW